MPIYEYRCTEGHEFELQQRIGDPPLKRCKCGKLCHRLLFPTNFVLKGGGWAKDSYSPSGEKKEKK
jgi:putative FmdB family regulatory protein